VGRKRVIPWGKLGYLRGTEPVWESGARHGFFECVPVSVGSGTTSATTWARVDCARFLPPDAQSVVLAVTLHSTDNDMVFQSRSSAAVSARSFRVAQGKVQMQVIQPLGALSTFDWQVVVSTGTTGWTAFDVSVIGWYGPEDQRQPR